MSFAGYFLIRSLLSAFPTYLRTYFRFDLVWFRLCVCVCVCVCVCACFFSISGRSGFTCFSTRPFFGLFCAKCPPPLLSLPPLLYSRVAAADGSFHVSQEQAGWAENQCAWVVQKAALSECQVDTVTSLNLVSCFHHNSKTQHT